MCVMLRNFNFWLLVGVIARIRTFHLSSHVQLTTITHVQTSTHCLNQCLFMCDIGMLELAKTINKLWKNII